jgi:hypothetical protein
VKDAQAVSAERKKSHRQGQHGIIVASFGKISDKRKEMEKKSQLKDSRNYKDKKLYFSLFTSEFQPLLFQNPHSTYLHPRRLFCIKLSFWPL